MSHSNKHFVATRRVSRDPKFIVPPRRIPSLRPYGSHILRSLTAFLAVKLTLGPGFDATPLIMRPSTSLNAYIVDDVETHACLREFLDDITVVCI